MCDSPKVTQAGPIAARPWIHTASSFPAAENGCQPELLNCTQEQGIHFPEHKPLLQAAPALTNRHSDNRCARREGARAGRAAAGPAEAAPGPASGPALPGCGLCAKRGQLQVSKCLQSREKNGTVASPCRGPGPHQQERPRLLGLWRLLCSAVSWRQEIRAEAHCVLWGVY